MLLAVLGHLRFSAPSVAATRSSRRSRWPAGLALLREDRAGLPLLFVVTWLFFVGPVDLARPGLDARGATGPRGSRTARSRCCYARLLCDRSGEPRPRRTLGDEVATTIDIAMRRTVIPGSSAGPWRWKPLGAVDSLADPHPIAQLVAACVSQAVVVYSSALSRGAWRAWALLARRHRASSSAFCSRPGCRSSAPKPSRPSTATSPTSDSWPRSQSGSRSCRWRPPAGRDPDRLDAPRCIPRSPRTPATCTGRRSPVVAITRCSRGSASLRRDLSGPLVGPTRARTTSPTPCRIFATLARRRRRLRRSQCPRRRLAAALARHPARRDWSQPTGIDAERSADSATRPQTCVDIGARRRPRVSPRCPGYLDRTRPDACGWADRRDDRSSSPSTGGVLLGLGGRASLHGRRRRRDRARRRRHDDRGLAARRPDRVVTSQSRARPTASRSVRSKAALHLLRSSSDCPSRWSGDGEDRDSTAPSPAHGRLPGADLGAGAGRARRGRAPTPRSGPATIAATGVLVVGAAGLRRRVVLRAFGLPAVSIAGSPQPRSSRDPPDGGRYFRKRAVRILPAYWLDRSRRVSCSCTSDDGRGQRPSVRTLTFTQVYGGDFQHRGLTQMWSLCVEVAFYLLLPLLAWLGCGSLPRRLATAACCSSWSARSACSPRSGTS